MAQAEEPGMNRIIYPAYINKSRTVAKGRRIPLQHAVVDPKPNEITDALSALKGIRAQIEVGPYCREINKELVPWRIKYVNAQPSKNNLNNKRQLLVACAKRIAEVRSKSGPSNPQPETSGKQKKKK